VYVPDPDHTLAAEAGVKKRRCFTTGLALSGFGVAALAVAVQAQTGAGAAGMESGTGSGYGSGSAYGTVDASSLPENRDIERGLERRESTLDGAIRRREAMLGVGSDPDAAAGTDSTGVPGLSGE
jgi:hypothetical protein